MHTIAVVSIMFAAPLLCTNGADAAPWCAEYGFGGTNCGKRRILLAEFIRESVLDRRGLAKALSTQLLEKVASERVRE